MDNRRRIDPAAAEKVFLAAGLKPLVPITSTRLKVKSECLRCGNEVEPRYSAIQQGQKGCRPCFANSMKLTDEQVKALLEPKNLLPLGPYVNSHTNIICECQKCKNIVPIRLNSVKSLDKGCKYCASIERSNSLIKFRIIYPSKSNRKSKERIIAPILNVEGAIAFLRQRGFEPLEEYRGSKKPWKSIHLSCGNEAHPTLSTLKAGWGGCQKCRKNADIDPTDALRIMQENHYEPLEPFKGNQINWQSKCMDCGRISKPRLHDVKKGKRCGYCSQRRIDPEEAHAVMIANDLTPLEPFRGSKKPWKCRHEICGEIVSPIYNTVQQGQGGCKHCSSSFDFKKPSYFYIMTHSDFQSVKVGIGNYDNAMDRIKTHIKGGWETFRIFDFATGEAAKVCEKTVLEWVRKTLKLGIHLNKDLMPFGGYSETIDMNEVSLMELEKYTKQVIKNLELI